MHPSRPGFTLTELLIVMVVIGILATIAIPRFTRVRERAYFKAMVSDLRNLISHQENYYALPAHNFSYASTMTSLGASPSPGVTITIAAGNQGWQATTSHSALEPTQNCGVYFGSPGSFPAPYVDTPGVVKCTGE